MRRSSGPGARTRRIAAHAACGALLGAAVMAAAQPATAREPSEFIMQNAMTWDCLDATTVNAQVTFCDQRNAQTWDGYLLGGAPGWLFYNADYHHEFCLVARSITPGAQVDVLPCSTVTDYGQYWFTTPPNASGTRELRPSSGAFTTPPKCLAQSWYGTAAVIEVCDGSRWQQWALREI
ncbi:hypothetical protein EDD29_5169 [Actinocorallia herbida]|uniref:Uncharacterized protein n=1 Tax=Actinocorallia herbida TaxID=58109 RepID=A0A3N1D1Z4_9ACTN|nr:RICIN domain-containing protein [Actinocorallia herbida]ROO87557.1 hypothetical protein EDD29_5169 [Actinocorallia herbida]